MLSQLRELIRWFGLEYFCQEKVLVLRQKFFFVKKLFFLRVFIPSVRGVPLHRCAHLVSVWLACLLLIFPPPCLPPFSSFLLFAQTACNSP